MKPIVSVTLFCLAIFLSPQPAQADPHREATDPTAWWWYFGQSHAQIVEVIEETGARLIDIEIMDSDPMSFTAAFVHNSGVYQEGWWWYFNMTVDDIATQLDNNQARLIDIERYDTDAGPRYAVIMVDNTSADAQPWWWYVGGDADFVSQALASHNARLVDIEAYQDGRTRYAVIMKANEGAQQSDWWWYYNVPASTLIDNMAANNSRILEFQVRSAAAGTYDAILIPNSGPDAINWWWYYGLTPSQLNALVNQNGARITDIDFYFNGVTPYFSVVMVNNSNELTTKMGGLLDYGADGSTGAYLKEVRGPVLAALQPDFVYEPASSLKVTHHLYTMRQVQFGYDDLSEELVVGEGIMGLSCPTGLGPFNIQTLEETLAGMMQLSDNTDTYAIESRYSRTVINDMSANVVGMVNTRINHRLGCAWDPLNEMTLRDSGLLYEKVASEIVIDATHKEIFYSLMQNEDTASPWWFTVDMFNLIGEVATDLGHPEMAADYWNNTRLAWKPGGDDLAGPSYYRAVSGWVQLPWCDEMADSKEYVFGLFIHNASNQGYSNDRLGLAFELFRDEVTAGLLSCLSGVPDHQEVAKARMLQASHPNPFNPRTTIKYNLENRTAVTVTVYDLTGRELVVLLDEVMDSGAHRLVWNGQDSAGRAVGSGAYIVRLRTPEEVESQKIMLVR